MAQLAIRGHATRGNEVIEILRMFGGKLGELYLGNVITGGYYIDSNGHINCRDTDIFDDAIIYTLDEFLEKFPYKVGDKVKFNEYTDIYTIFKMIWDTKLDDVIFQFTESGDNWWHKDGLQLCKKVEPMKRKIESIEIIESHCADEVKIEFDRSKYEMVKREEGYYVVKKQPQYPKTFIEVLNFWHPDRQIEDDYQRCYKKDLLEKFQDLLYARDAYWKIAGEQMGLGKPWEPDWTDNYQKKWIINFYQGKINFTTGPNVQFILAFPTVEMRDTFFENFKELIKECINLL